MALPNGDMWNKFELNVSEKMDFSPMDSDESDSVFLSSSAAVVPPASRAKKDALRDTSLHVPDIADILADTTTFDLDINMDGGIDMDFDNFLDDILSLEKDPLRHDCMWTGDCTSEEHHPSWAELVGSHQKQDHPPPGSINLGSSSKDLSCYDTPLSSETSDLDETSSDIEADVEVGTELGDRLLQTCRSAEPRPRSSLDFTFSDHCYIATSAKEQTSAADPRSRTSPDSGFTSQSTFRIPTYPTTTKYRRTPTSLAKLASSRPSLAKFKFQLKFKKSGASDPNARSVLRPGQRTLAGYERRTEDTQKLFNSFASKSVQLSKTQVYLDQESPKWLEDDGRKSTKMAGGGGNKRDVRDMHNILERQRRIDLKNAFDILKGAVPDLVFSEKASKLMILTKATSYCRSLLSTEARLKKDLEAAKVKKAALLRKLNHVSSRK